MCVRVEGRRPVYAIAGAGEAGIYDPPPWVLWSSALTLSGESFPRLVPQLPHPRGGAGPRLTRSFIRWGGGGSDALGALISEHVALHEMALTVIAAPPLAPPPSPL